MIGANLELALFFQGPIFPDSLEKTLVTKRVVVKTLTYNIEVGIKPRVLYP